MIKNLKKILVFRASRTELDLGCLEWIVWSRGSQSESTTQGTYTPSGGVCVVEMKTDRIRTDIIDIIFVFIFLVEFGFEYG